MKEFSTRVIEWHKKEGRKNLPWQKRKSPYKVWISEVMLQQTQVVTVIPYFIKFIKRFPDVKKLSEANLDEVLGYWSGLGYYARARNIHLSAREIVFKHKGKVPNSFEELIELPGIGKSTAGAIISLGFKKKAAILDGNVQRVLTRHFKIQQATNLSKTQKTLWALAEKLLPINQFDIYSQSIMDLGATICTKSEPNCRLCPINQDCIALKEGLVRSLPKKTESKHKPIKKVCWLIPQNSSGEVLLEKRINKGLWGGLWTFIESERKEKLKQQCIKKYKFEFKKLEQLSKVKHNFSHYQLEAIPYLMELNTNKKYKNTVWVNTKNVESMGMPSPIKKIIEEIYTT